MKIAIVREILAKISGDRNTFQGVKVYQNISRDNYVTFTISMNM